MLFLRTEHVTNLFCIVPNLLDVDNITNAFVELASALGELSFCQFYVWLLISVRIHRRLTTFFF